MVFYVVLGAVMDELAMMLLTVQTASGPLYYGPSGAPISTQDGCTLRLELSGSVRCITSLTDQGQGTLTAIAQIVADSVGVSVVDACRSRRRKSWRKSRPGAKRRLDAQRGKFSGRRAARSYQGKTVPS